MTDVRTLGVLPLVLDQLNLLQLLGSSCKQNSSSKMEAASKLNEIYQLCYLESGYFLWLITRSYLVNEESLVSAY